MEFVVTRQLYGRQYRRRRLLTCRGSAGAIAVVCHIAILVNDRYRRKIVLVLQRLHGRFPADCLLDELWFVTQIYDTLRHLAQHGACACKWRFERPGG